MSAANWFVGVSVPGDWMHACVPDPPAGIRRFHPEDLHLTIAFLGACGEERARAAWAALTWPEIGIDASLGAVVPMGNPRRYSALSALLVTGREQVELAIGSARDAVCAAAGAIPDTRPPKAHLTLARPGRRTTDEQRREALRWAASLHLEDVRVRLGRLALYTWSEDRAERLFRAVEQRELLAP